MPLPVSLSTSQDPIGRKVVPTVDSDDHGHVFYPGAVPQHVRRAAGARQMDTGEKEGECQGLVGVRLGLGSGLGLEG